MARFNIGARVTVKSGGRVMTVLEHNAQQNIYLCSYYEDDDVQTARPFPEHALCTPNEQPPPADPGQWIERYPWENPEHRKAFLAFCLHMQKVTAPFTGEKTDLQALAAYLFGKDIEATVWWRSYLEQAETGIRQDLLIVRGQLEQELREVQAEIATLKKELAELKTVPVP